MWPFSYKRCATDIVYFAEKPSFRDASCCSVVVRNGAYGDRRYGLRSTDLTEYDAPDRRAATAAADAPSRCRICAASAAPEPLSSPTELKSRPCATRLPSTDTSVAVKNATSAAAASCGSKSASRSQY